MVTVHGRKAKATLLEVATWLANGDHDLGSTHRSGEVLIQGVPSQSSQQPRATFEL